MLLREYEISVWEDILSDDKTTYNEHPIAVIGSNTMTSDCAAQDAHFNKKATGEYTLSFILYTQYFDKNWKIQKNMKDRRCIGNGYVVDLLYL